MVEHGHSWRDIQTYTLSEIGEFLSVVVSRKSTKASEQLSLLWMGSNITHDGLMQVTKGLENKSTKEIERTSRQRVSTDVKRLMGASQTY